MPLGLGINTRRLAEGVAHLETPGQGAGECAADPDTDLAGRLLAEPRVKSHQLEDIDWLEFKARCNPIDTAVIDESEVILPQVKQGKGSTTLGDGIMGNRLVDFCQQVGRDPVSLSVTGVGGWMNFHEELKETKKSPFRKADNGPIQPQGKIQVTGPTNPGFK